jgi:sugar/nucleoside kinase (ribokinase family)
MKKILGIGNALVDVLIRLESDYFLDEYGIPKGSMQLVNYDFANLLTMAVKNKNPQVSSGGSAANTIHGLAQLGSQTAYIGKIGNDKFGKLFADDLEMNKIKPMLSYGIAETGRAITLITPDSERTFATYLGAAIELDAADMSDILFKGFDLLHIEGYLVQNRSLVEKSVALAKRANLKVSLDMASYNVVEDNKDFLQKIIKKYVDVVFANEEEAKAMTGLNPEAALNEIAKYCEIAVVKIGAEGSLIKKNDKTYSVQPIKAQCIDTTGAGDLYASGFLYGYSKDMSMEMCGAIGSLTAGKVVETIGAKIGDSAWYEIKRIINAL